MPRRVLVTCDDDTWSYALSIARSVAPAGVDVVLAPTAPIDPVRRASAEGLLVLETPAEGGAEWLLDAVHRLAIDVVHLQGDALAGLRWGRRVVVSLNREPEGDPADVARRLRAADLVVAPTRCLLDALEHGWGPLGPTACVPWAVRTPPRRRRPSMPFVLVGAGPDDSPGSLASLDRACFHLPVPAWGLGIGAGQTGCIRPLGQPRPDEAAIWLRRAAVFAVPVRGEPHGLLALEAGASACALVLPDTAVARETWGDAACYVAPDDEEALVETLDALVSVEGLRAELGARARARVAERPPARMAEAWIAAWAAPRRVPWEVSFARSDVLPVAPLGLESP